MFMSYTSVLVPVRSGWLSAASLLLLSLLLQRLCCSFKLLPWEETIVLCDPAGMDACKTTCLKVKLFKCVFSVYPELLAQFAPLPPVAEVWVQAPCSSPPWRHCSPEPRPGLCRPRPPPGSCWERGDFSPQSLNLCRSRSRTRGCVCAPAAVGSACTSASPHNTWCRFPIWGLWISSCTPSGSSWSPFLSPFRN